MTKHEKYEGTKKGRINRLLKAARRRAREKGVTFSITRKWLEEIIEAGVCEVTGVKFLYYKKENYQAAPFVPSLDRINPLEGYTPENTQIVLNCYNIFKWQWDKQDLKKIIKILKSVKI